MPQSRYSAAVETIPLGDSALLIRVRPDSEAGKDETLAAVLSARDGLARAEIPGVIELATAYTTVAVFFDAIKIVEAGAPAESIFEWLRQRISDALEKGSAKVALRNRRNVEIPVCYDRDFATDLEEVSRHTGLTGAEVIRRHSEASYRVQCVGFTPGFPFLSGLPAELATPRRSTPRAKVPSGSVGIGGGQTGIYPLQSPGGWNIIGRTPIALFDVLREPPALLQPGDGVRFRSISRSQFENWQQ